MIILSFRVMSQKFGSRVLEEKLNYFVLVRDDKTFL